MREIVVARPAIKIPVAGFGCSALTGSGRSNALRALEAAFDAGVRHFDVARYYGFGEAEGILGAFLKTRRSQVTITTKFGIQPPQRTTSWQFALHVGRRIVRLLPAARGFMQRRSQRFVKSGAFSMEEAQASLETSLRALGTDHIDFYLLHDYTVNAQPPDELVGFLESTVKAGKVGCFGTGSSFGNVLLALEHQPKLCNVIQFQNSALTQNMDRLPSPNSDRLVITHGSLGGSYRSLVSFLTARRELAKEWAAKLGLGDLNEDTLSALMLGYAVNANPNGLVLFSSRDPVRVHKNAKAVLEPSVSAIQTALFAELVKRGPPLIQAK